MGDIVYSVSFPAKKIIEKIKKENKLEFPDFSLKMPLFKVSKFPEKLGFTPDPKIARLVRILNCLGVRTSECCEGHLKRN